MPSYKNLPKRKERATDLPLYRPIDKVVHKMWGLKSKLTPVLIVAGLALLVFFGYKFYANHYEKKAKVLFQSGENEKVVSLYPRSSAAFLSRMKLGRKALDDKKYDEAIQWYAPLTDQKSVADIIHVGAIQNLAFAYLKKGEGQRSVELLEKISKDPKNVMADYSRLLLARTYETKGDKEKALQLYKELSEGSATSNIRDEARERSEWLNQ